MFDTSFQYPKKGICTEYNYLCNLKPGRCTHTIIIQDSFNAFKKLSTQLVPNPKAQLELLTYIIRGK